MTIIMSIISFSCAFTLYVVFRWKREDTQADPFLTKQWRLIAVCAVVGLAVTVFIAYRFASADLDASLFRVFAVLCPPALLCIPLSDAMTNIGGFYAIWSVIGLANSGLYGMAGAVAAGQLWAPE